MIGRLMHAQAAFRRKEKCGCYRGVEMKLNWTTFGQPQQPVGGRTRNGIHLMLFEKQTYNTERRVLKRRTMLREPRQDNMPARCCCSRCSSAVCLSSMMMINIFLYINMSIAWACWFLLLIEPGGDDIALIIIYFDGSPEIRRNRVRANKSRRLFGQLTRGTPQPNN